MIQGIGQHKASGKILNTNLGVGFTRGRKYDTDLDRLGRMETSHSELRKTGELGREMRKLNQELRDMRKTYSIKRFSQIYQKQYGMGDIANSVGNGVRDATGSVLHGAGSMLDNGLTKTAAGIAGATGGLMAGASLGAKAGSFIGNALGGPILGGVPGALVGGALGALAAPFVAAKGVGMAGKALKEVGDDIHT